MFLILFLILLKIVFTFYVDHFGWDGSYYYNIAQNILEGNGFVTNISLYHQGFTYFPHPTPVYPIWPIVMGYVSYFISLPVTAIWLPTILYILTLWVTYKTVDRIVPGPLIQFKKLSISAASLMTLILGLHTDFFYATSKPYTEAIGFFVLSVFFLRFSSLKGNINSWIAFEFGIWSAVLFLIRSQFIIFFISLIVFYIILLSFYKRIGYLKWILISSAGFLLFNVPQMIHLYHKVHDIGINSIIFFDQYQASSLLTPIQSIVDYENIFTWFWFKIYGFFIAFLPFGKKSYIINFYGFQYSFVLAFIVLVWKKNYRHIYDKLTKFVLEPKDYIILFFIIFAFIEFISIHLIHKKMWAVWNFATRHSVVCSFFFFICFIYILKLRRARKIGMILIFMATLAGFTNITIRTIYAAYNNVPIEHKRSELIQYINSMSKTEPRIIVMYNPQWLAPYTPKTYYHWIYEGTSEDDMKILFQTMKSDNLLLNRIQYKKFIQNIPSFSKEFSILEENLSGMILLQYKHAK